MFLFSFLYISVLPLSNCKDKSEGIYSFIILIKLKIRSSGYL
jgi:hypothetical protein